MITNNIKNIRMKLNITQEQLAITVNITSKSIYNIENGKKDTTIKIAQKIKKALQCKSLDELFPDP
ncbi:MAG TPA: helix-turn-helix transcriptional regulator [Candidatus Paceibacterota bacterium]